MEERGHQVGLTKPSLADHDQRPPLPGTNRFDAFQQIVCGVSDIEEFLRSNLGGAGIGIVRELDRSALEALAPEFFS